MIPIALAGLLMTFFVIYLENQINLQHAKLYILGVNILLFVAVLVFLSRRPPSNHNRRVPVPSSRYNPQWRTATAEAVS